MQISSEWRALKLADHTGLLLVIGASDTGKSTFARYLFGCLQDLGRRVAFIDGDPGQSALGPPTTLSLTFHSGMTDSLQAGHTPKPVNQPQTRRFFVGSITPQGHMLPVLVGASRLAQAAQEHGAEVVVYDTSGLVDGSRGGLALKIAKIDLLRPNSVFAIQRESELEPLLQPLRLSRRVHLIGLRPSPAVVRRDTSARRQYRARQFADYFASARPLDFEWTRLAVLPHLGFRLHRLVALEDQQGFTLGLGIVVAIDRPARRVRLLSPLSSLNGVNAVRLGDMLVDPETFQDEQIMG